MKDYGKSVHLYYYSNPLTIIPVFPLVNVLTTSNAFLYQLSTCLLTRQPTKGPSLNRPMVKGGCPNCKTQKIKLIRTCMHGRV